MGVSDEPGIGYTQPPLPPPFNPAVAFALALHERLVGVLEAGAEQALEVLSRLRDRLMRRKA